MPVRKTVAKKPSSTKSAAKKPSKTSATTRKPRAATKTTKATSATKTSKTQVAKKPVAAPRKSAAKTAAPRKSAAKTLAPRKSTVKALARTTVEKLDQRAILIDVENTSSEEGLLAALDTLKFEKVGPDMKLLAVGNWRVIGAHVGRMLASRGARLIHTAPATGVKDWSDLSIAVAAGIWLGRATPGDSIEIVSADRAFDAVGDAATALGIDFRRISYASPTRAATSPAAAPRRRSRRGSGRSRRPIDSAVAEIANPIDAEQTQETHTPEQTTPQAITVAPVTALPPVLTAPNLENTIHAAPPEKITEIIRKLTEINPDRGVNLDLLINALKEEGFGRPAGSSRLVTRLRRLKEVEVSPTGMVRLLTGTTTPTPQASPSDEGDTTVAPARRPRRRGRRGGRGRNKPTEGETTTTDTGETIPDTSEESAATSEESAAT